MTSFSLIWTLKQQNKLVKLTEIKYDNVITYGLTLHQKKMYVNRKRLDLEQQTW